MNRKILFGIFFILIVAFELSNSPEKFTESKREIKKFDNKYGVLPLRFVENIGQMDEQFRFVSQGGKYKSFLAPGGAIISLTQHEKDQIIDSNIIHLQFLNSDQNALIEGIDALASRSNYLNGNNPEKWHTNVKHYERVKYSNLYPDIDLILYGNQQRLEYDFVIKPGGNPDQIELCYEGADSIYIDKDGNLILSTNTGNLIQGIPKSYQEINGKRKPIKSNYLIQSAKEKTVKLALGNYDSTQNLVIDPIIHYSTYLGGSRSDVCRDIAVDDAGNAYVIGTTRSEDFLLKNPYQQTKTASPSFDAFITKIDKDGALVYSTFIGGSDGTTSGISIEVDNDGNVYAIGITNTTDFPLVRSIQDTLKSNSSEEFVLTLSANGSELLFSTYFGGFGTSGRGDTQDIAVDKEKNIYITGSLNTDLEFPITNTFQELNLRDFTHNGFVAKINPATSQLVYSIPFNGLEPKGIAVDHLGQAHVIGTAYASPSDISPQMPLVNALQNEFKGGPPFADSDPYVMKISNDGSELLFATYFGGKGESRELGNSIAIDDSGYIYILGTTDREDLPTTPNAYRMLRFDRDDIFVAKLSPDGSQIIYCTYVGGDGDDRALKLDLDKEGNVYLVATTTSRDIPNVNSISDRGDVFIGRLNADGSNLDFTTRWGGENDFFSIGVDTFKNIYIAGGTDNSRYPTVNAFQNAYRGSIDAYVAKIVGFAPFNIVVSQDTVSFGGIEVTDSGTTEILIQNKENAPINMALTTSDIHFTLTPDTLMIAPNDSSLIRIDFHPSEVIGYTGTLIIKKDDPWAEQISVALNGTGLETPGNLLLDLNPSEGNQNEVVSEFSTGNTVVVQLFSQDFPEISGFGMTIKFNSTELSYIEDSFTLGEFIPDAIPLVTARADSLELGIASFNNVTNQGNHYLGSLAFQVNDVGQDSSKIVVSSLGYSLPSGGLKEKNVNSTAIVVKVEPTILGDFDDDGSVGFRDFLLFSQAFGGTDPQFDLNEDGNVGFPDFIIFAQAFGTN